eukprot:3512524-Amphidinium_carterae.2
MQSTVSKLFSSSLHQTTIDGQTAHFLQQATGDAAYMDELECSASGRQLVVPLALPDISSLVSWLLAFLYGDVPKNFFRKRIEKWHGRLERYIREWADNTSIQFLLKWCRRSCVLGCLRRSGGQKEAKAEANQCAPHVDNTRAEKLEQYAIVSGLNATLDAFALGDSCEFWRESTILDIPDEYITTDCFE